MKLPNGMSVKEGSNIFDVIDDSNWVITFRGFYVGIGRESVGSGFRIFEGWDTAFSTE